MTYSNNNNVGSFKDWLRKPPHPGPDRVLLRHPDGCTFEADRGVPLVLVVTKLQEEIEKVRGHLFRQLACCLIEFTSLGQSDRLGVRILLGVPLQ
jgi:hypothetical protein